MENLSLDVSSLNLSSQFSGGSGFDLASCIQYGQGLPKFLFWFLLVGFVLYLIRLVLVKLGWLDDVDSLKFDLVGVLDLVGFVCFGISLLFGWLFVFKPSVGLIEKVSNVGLVMLVFLFGWFGFVLWQNNKKGD